MRFQNKSVKDGPTDGLTDGLTDRPVDRPSYRNVRTHLIEKKEEAEKEEEEEQAQECTGVFVCSQALRVSGFENAQKQRL